MSNQTELSEENWENADFEEVESDFWKPHEDGPKSVIGRVMGTESTEHGDAIKIRQQDGNEILANFTALNQKLRDRVGDIVRVTHLGTETSKHGREYQTFKIEVAK